MGKTIKLKKIPFKKILLIILFVMSILSLFYISYFVKHNFNQINFEYKAIEPTDFHINSKVETANSLDNKELQNQIEYLTTQINNIKKENYELEQKLNNNKQNYKNEEKITYNILLNKLLNTLKTNKPFEDTLSTLLIMNQKNLIFQDLKELANYSQGVETLENLTYQFQNIIYKDIYLNELKKKSSFISQIEYIFYSFIFIKNTQPTSTNTISYNLSLVELNLLENNPQLALQIFNTNNFTLNNKTLAWVNDLQKRIKINIIAEKIKNNISS